MKRIKFANSGILLGLGVGHFQIALVTKDALKEEHHHDHSVSPFRHGSVRSNANFWLPPFLSKMSCIIH